MLENKSVNLKGFKVDTPGRIRMVCGFLQCNAIAERVDLRSSDMREDGANVLRETALHGHVRWSDAELAQIWSHVRYVRRATNSVLCKEGEQAVFKGNPTECALLHMALDMGCARAPSSAQPTRRKRHPLQPVPAPRVPTHHHESEGGSCS